MLLNFTSQISDSIETMETKMIHYQIKTSGALLNTVEL